MCYAIETSEETTVWPKDSQFKIQVFLWWTAKLCGSSSWKLKAGKKTLFSSDIKSGLYTSYIYSDQQNSCFDIICIPFVQLFKAGP